MTPVAYPLCWPESLPRNAVRVKSSFNTTLVRALDNVETSLHLFGKDSGRSVAGVVLSSNVTIGVPRPDDPGIAAWFEWDGAQRCIAVDRYRTPAENLQAVHHILEARRTEMRHGGLTIVRQTFKGFLALPAAGPSWRQLDGKPLVSVQMEAAEMICVKPARLVCGDIPHADSWRDIEGYARLGRGWQPTEAPPFDLVAHLERQRTFSEKNFGPGPRAAGVVDHIRKELVEVEAAPNDLSEWIDVIILAFDGAWREGYSSAEIVAALVTKQTRNEARRWPDWRTAEPGKAIEHIRPEGEK